MSKMAEFLARVGNCNSDDDFDEIMRMLEPQQFSSDEEAGDHFISVIGYNPITYYDRVYLEDCYPELVDQAPDDVIVLLDEKRNEIIEKTLENMREADHGYLMNVLIATVRAETGWFPADDFVNLNHTIMDIASEGEGFEIEEIDEEPDPEDLEDDEAEFEVDPSDIE